MNRTEIRPFIAISSLCSCVFKPICRPIYWREFQCARRNGREKKRTVLLFQDENPPRPASRKSLRPVDKISRDSRVDLKRHVKRKLGYLLLYIYGFIPVKFLSRIGVVKYNSNGHKHRNGGTTAIFIKFIKKEFKSIFTLFAYNKYSSMR